MASLIEKFQCEKKEKDAAVTSLKEQIEELKKASDESSKREKQLSKYKMDSEKKIHALEILAETEKRSENSIITKLEKDCNDLREVETKLRRDQLTAVDVLASFLGTG